MNAGLMPMTAVPSKVTSVGMSSKPPATIIVVNHLRRVICLEVVHPTLVLHGELRRAGTAESSEQAPILQPSEFVELKVGCARINRKIVDFPRVR